MFPNSGLFELYGSTEAGWVTMLQPDEQFTKLGSVGRECVGSAPDQAARRRAATRCRTARPASSTRRNPYTFDGYWKLPEKTAEAFRGDYCTVGDMARRDADGYIHLVDRKSNMIISGGENVYPSEVEARARRPSEGQGRRGDRRPRREMGRARPRRRRPHDGATPTEAELLDWCKDRIAGYKRPRSISFIAEDEMPRTATGKILHRVLRTQLTRRTGS